MPRRGVFKIINKKTGKVYIGSSDKNMDNLIYSYWQKLKSGDHHNRELQSDFDYWGSNNFKYEIVEDRCQSEDEVRLIRESEIYSNRHNTYNEDVPVHYDGGNSNASYGGYSRKQNRVTDDLKSYLVGPKLSSYNRRNLENRIDSGSIRTVEQLKNEIKKIEINPNYYDDNKIKMLADTYCAFTKYGKWNRDKETIIFEMKYVYFSPEETGKQINIKDLSKEIDTIRRQILYSPPKDSSIKMNVYQLSSLFCELYGFKSFELIDYHQICFDGYYKIYIHYFEKIFKLTGILSGDKSPEIHEQEIENKLNKIIKTEYFEQPLERLLNEYCEYRKINSWDLIGNNEILFFAEKISISSVNDFISILNDKYKELTQKLGVLDLRNIYNVFKRRRNDDGRRTASVDSLLSILFKSDLTLSDKFNLRKEINHGRINSKNELISTINTLSKREIVNQRRKINYVSPQDKFYNVKGKTQPSIVLTKCPKCGAVLKNNSVECHVCRYNIKLKKYKTSHKKIKKPVNDVSSKDKKYQKEKKTKKSEMLRVNSNNKNNKQNETKEEVKPTKNKVFKVCADCHEKVNIGATVCSKCRSNSFVYDKNSSTLSSFSIHNNRNLINKEWEYVQVTDNGELRIYAKSRRELKNKIISNDLPWDDAKADKARKYSLGKSNRKPAYRFG